MNQKENEGEPEAQISKIVKEHRQLSIRIPAKFVDKLRINTEKDRFLWRVIDNKEGLSLEAILIKDFPENEEKNNK